MYLPPNVTAIVQPMDQGAISLTKRHYKHHLLRTALLDREGTVKFLKEINLTDCFIHLQNAWNSLRESTLNKMWKPLLGESCIIREESLFNDRLHTSAVINVDNVSDTEAINFPEDVCKQLSIILERIDRPRTQVEADLSVWFNSDDSDCGWEPLTDDNIINFVTGREIDLDVEAVNAENIEKNKNDNSTLNEISAPKALESLKLLKNWMETCNEFLPHHYDCLKEIENITEKNVKEFST